MAKAYIPDAGDIVWLNFTPQAGHEQAGHRPALVISPKAYNQKTGLMGCCPMTTQIKGYPFEVRLSGNPTNVVLADQVKSLDWKSRKAKRINISIKPFKGVTVSVPRYVTFKQAVKVVKNKTDWILEHQKKMKESEEKATIFDEYTSFNTRKHKLQIIKYDKKDVLVKITQDKTIISYPSSFDVGSDYVQQSIKWGITEIGRAHV